jgi:signal transduction histidine kinase
VDIRLGTSSGRLKLVVRDNGRGIQTTDLEGVSSLGLVGMRERAELAGGKFRIRPLSGTGTEVTVTLPLEAQRSQLAV